MEPLRHLDGTVQHLKSTTKTNSQKPNRFSISSAPLLPWPTWPPRCGMKNVASHPILPILIRSSNGEILPASLNFSSVISTPFFQSSRIPCSVRCLMQVAMGSIIHQKRRTPNAWNLTWNGIRTFQPLTGHFTKKMAGSHDLPKPADLCYRIHLWLINWGSVNVTQFNNQLVCRI